MMTPKIRGKHILDVDVYTSSEDEEESEEDESKMNSVVSKRKIMLGTMLPLKSVETESGMADTLAETGTGTGVCRKKPKEHFDDAKTIAEVIPCIIGSSTKLKLSKMIASLLRRKGRECAYVNRSISAGGGGLCHEWQN